MKVCPSCNQNKPNSQFYTNRAKASGLNSYCKECSHINRLAWAKANPVKTATNQRIARLRTLYGITLEQYNELLQRQGGSCGVCRRPAEQFPKNLAVDHDHHTGLIRGLLCIDCNRRVIGRRRAPEGILLFHNASEYLKTDTGWVVPPKKRKRKKK